MSGADSLGRVVIAKPLTGPTRISLTRYTSTGAVDTSYGTAGVATLAMASTGTGQSLTMLPDGRVVLLVGTASPIVAYRFTSTGALDTSFATGGSITISGVTKVANISVASDGTITAGTVTATPSVVLNRYAPSGALDTSFDGDGVAEVSCCPGYSGTVVLDAVVGGPSGSVSVMVERSTNGTGWAFAVSSSGTATVPADLASAGDLQSITLEDNGGALVIGVGTNSYVAVRLDASSNRIVGFAGTGTFAITGKPGTPLAVGTRFYLPSRVSSGSTNYVAALAPSGPDPTFGIGGLVNLGSFGDTAVETTQFVVPAPNGVAVVTGKRGYVSYYSVPQNYRIDHVWKTGYVRGWSGSGTNWPVAMSAAPGGATALIESQSTSLLTGVTYSLEPVSYDPTALVGSSLTHLNTNRNVTTPFTIDAADPDGLPLTYTITQQPAHGTVTCNGPNCTVFVPPTVAYGSTDSFKFTVSNGTTTRATTTSTFVGNDGPVGTPQAVDGVARGAPKTITLAAVDPNGDPVVSYTASPQDSRTTLSCTTAGVCTFTAKPTTATTVGIVGNTHFTFSATDSYGARGYGENVTVNVTDQAPTVDAKMIDVSPSQPSAFTLTGSDPNGDYLKYSVVTPPQKGTVVCTGTDKAACTYTPSSGASGTDSLTVTAFDGNLTSASAVITLHITPPDLQAPTVSCDPVPSGWVASNVSVACTGSDGESGLASSGDASFSLSTNVLDGTESSSAVTGSRSVCDVAGNCTGVGPFSVKVDRKGPTVSATSPVEDQQVTRYGSLFARYSADDAGSGLASLVGSTHQGWRMPTDQLGPQTMTVDATDAVGNLTTAVVHYTVVDGPPAFVPSSVAATPTGNVGSLRVQWGPPDPTNPGASPQSQGITGYRVVWDGGSVEVDPSLLRSAVITGLAPGVPVSFRVQAFNQLGGGPLSDPSVPVAPDAAPPSGTDVERLVPEQAGLDSDPYGWTATGATVSESSTAWSGDHSLVLTSTTSGSIDAITSPGGATVRVAAGEQATATARVRADGAPRPARLSLVWLDAGGAPVGVSSSGPQSDDGWTTLTVTGSAPSTAVQVRARVVVDTTEPGEAHLLDGVEIAVGGGSASNALSPFQSDFEVGPYAWASLSGDADLSVDTNYAHSGAASIRDVPHALYSSVAPEQGDDMHVQDGSTVHGGMWARTETGTGSIQGAAAVIWLDGDGYMSSSIGDVATISDDGWIHLTTTADAPPGATAAQVVFAVLDDPSGQVVRLDDASLCGAATCLAADALPTSNLGLTTSGLEGSPYGWSASHGALAQVERDDGHALRLTADGRGAASASTDGTGKVVTVAPGATYTASVHVSSPDGAAVGTISAKIVFHDLDGTVVGESAADTVTASTGGATLAATGTAPDRAVTATLQVAAPEAATDGRVDLDDARIQTGSMPDPAGHNLLGGLESGFEPEPFGWYAAGSALERSTANPHSGTYDLQMTVLDSFAAAVSDQGTSDQAVTTGDKVTGSAWLRADQPTTVVIAIVWFGPDGFITSSTSDLIQLDDTWSHHNVTAAAPPGATSGTFGVAVVDDPAGQTIHIDDATLATTG
jgi:uncharacterized delta-60 repeat protein